MSTTKQHNIDIDALYILTTQNGQASQVTGSVLLHNYLNDNVNKDAVKSFERVPGQWMDVMYKGVKQFAVYAENIQEAIEQRWDDLVNIGKADKSVLTVKISTPTKTACFCNA